MTDDEKFKGKYRIASTRWSDWDYSSNVAYIVTICVANRAHVFGEIVDGAIKLNLVGQSAQDCWDNIPAHFPFVELGGFVVMPNHVHGAVMINKNGNVETQKFASLPPKPGIPKNHFGPQSQNLASIIRRYKIGATKYARKNNIMFEWQPRYHDHVIRNAQEGERIVQYILANPQHWQDAS